MCLCVWCSSWRLPSLALRAASSIGGVTMSLMTRALLTDTCGVVSWYAAGGVRPVNVLKVLLGLLP